MRRLRGKDIGFIFQDPLSSLNPTLTIGYQISESIRQHMGRRPRRPRIALWSSWPRSASRVLADRLNDYPPSSQVACASGR